MQFNPAGVNKTGKWVQGHFIPKNPQKIVGDITKLIYRSSWEKDFFNTCDINPAIMKWGAEILSIPYNCPVTGQLKNYFPDIFLCYMDKTGKIITECIEIKPEKQTLVEKAKSKKDKIQLLINQAKWKAAGAFCKNNGIKFRVLSERQLYGKK